MGGCRQVNYAVSRGVIDPELSSTLRNGHLPGNIPKARSGISRLLPSGPQNQRDPLRLVPMRHAHTSAARAFGMWSVRSPGACPKPNTTEGEPMASLDAYLHCFRRLSGEDKSVAQLMLTGSSDQCCMGKDGWIRDLELKNA